MATIQEIADQQAWDDFFAPPVRGGDSDPEGFPYWIQNMPKSPVQDQVELSEAASKVYRKILAADVEEFSDAVNAAIDETIAAMKASDSERYVRHVEFVNQVRNAELQRIADNLRSLWNLRDLKELAGLEDADAVNTELAEFIEIPQEELIGKMREAMKTTTFTSPVDPVQHFIRRSVNGEFYGKSEIVVGVESYKALRSFAIAQNDNLDSDVDLYEGVLMCRGVKVVCETIQNPDPNMYRNYSQECNPFPEPDAIVPTK